MLINYVQFDGFIL